MLDMGRRDIPGTREATVEIGRGAGMSVYPIVDQRVARSGVEGEDLHLLPDPGDVRDTADVEHGDRLRQGRGEGRVE